MKKIKNKCAKRRSLLAIIALVAVIGFGLVSCGTDDDGDGGTTPVAVTGVTLDQSSLSLAVGVTATLTATVAPGNATNKEVKWTTSDPTKATVAYGFVTAVAEGSATITVTTADGNKTATCSVTVIQPITVTEVTLDQSSLSLAVDDTATLTATITPDNATNKAVTWSTSSAAVATVSNGVVTAVAEGTATITVTTADGNKTATCTITVVQLVSLPATGVTTLNENTWEDGDLPTSSSEQWFKFNATASGQYIHANFGTLNFYGVYVQVYDSSGVAVENETTLNIYSNNKYINRTVTVDHEYYIKVRSFNSNSIGTYKIAFNTTINPPGTTVTTLNENTWEDSDLTTSSSEQWFKFNATASTQYIHFNPDTLDYALLDVYDSTGFRIEGKSSAGGYFSCPVTSGQDCYIRVLSEYSRYGTYKIGFNTTIIPPGAIPLTENMWADGNLPIPNSEQWFKFNATASKQYIHVKYGTLTFLNILVYDSSGKQIGSSVFNETFRVRNYTLTVGQDYYIELIPDRVNGRSGTYKIAFNTSTTPPK